VYTGVVWSLFGGLSIGLPPLMLFAQKSLRDRVVKPCLSGEKVICLAITEPTAGSDVAQLKCTAVLNKEKTHYIVNGAKKWITNGVYADFFTVAVRTGKPDSGMAGLSLLLLEKSMKGITPRQMKCSGVWPSGTALISFDNVMVPVGNLIGQENKGFTYIMQNFNHERFSICVQATRFARVCLEEVRGRVIFGLSAVCLLIHIFLLLSCAPGLRLLRWIPFVYFLLLLLLSLFVCLFVCRCGDLCFLTH
jgi:alkylation response protein AidB-like acyl-CoA dehydrogenase